jgi:ubiquinone/menaquinone biosynthesis C-methylase UbiE
MFLCIFLDEKGFELMKYKLRYIFGTLLGFLIVSFWRIYRSREKERLPSKESLDSPAVAAAFNRVASWPQMRLLRWYVARRILDLVQRGQAVDLGCGPGHLIFKLAQQAPELRTTGIDLSEEVLDQAETYSAQLGFDDRVSFKLGSAQEIPFPDGSFDLVISTLSLHHWSQPVIVFDEIFRVLSPGGSYLIFDLRRDMAAPFYVLVWIATRFIVPKALRQVNEPLNSRNAAYTVQEASGLVGSSKLSGWRITAGPLWLVIEGRKS